MYHLPVQRNRVGWFKLEPTEQIQARWWLRRRERRFSAGRERRTDPSWPQIPISSWSSRSSEPDFGRAFVRVHQGVQQSRLWGEQMALNNTESYGKKVPFPSLHACSAPGKSLVPANMSPTASLTAPNLLFKRKKQASGSAPTWELECQAPSPFLVALRVCILSNKHMDSPYGVSGSCELRSFHPHNNVLCSAQLLSFVLLMSELRHREVKSLARGHRSKTIMAETVNLGSWLLSPCS